MLNWVRRSSGPETLDQVLEATLVVGGGNAGADGVGLQGEGGRRRNR